MHAFSSHNQKKLSLLLLLVVTGILSLLMIMTQLFLGLITKEIWRYAGYDLNWIPYILKWNRGHTLYIDIPSFPLICQLIVTIVTLSRAAAIQPTRAISSSWAKINEVAIRIIQTIVLAFKKFTSNSGTSQIFAIRSLSFDPAMY